MSIKITLLYFITNEEMENKFKIWDNVVVVGDDKIKWLSKDIIGTTGTITDVTRNTDDVETHWYYVYQVGASIFWFFESELQFENHLPIINKLR